MSKIAAGVDARLQRAYSAGTHHPHDVHETYLESLARAVNIEVNRSRGLDLGRIKQARLYGNGQSACVASAFMLHEDETGENSEKTPFLRPSNPEI